MDLKKTFKPKTHTQKYYLDKFAFYKIGTLLNNSPKTIPIKAWQTKTEEQVIVEGHAETNDYQLAVKESLYNLESKIQILGEQQKLLQEYIKEGYLFAPDLFFSIFRINIIL